MGGCAQKPITHLSPTCVFLYESLKSTSLRHLTTLSTKVHTKHQNQMSILGQHADTPILVQK